MRYALLWFLGVPIPILLLIWMFGGLHGCAQLAGRRTRLCGGAGLGADI